MVTLVLGGVMSEYTQPNGFVHLLCFRRRTLISIEGYPLSDPVPGGAEPCSSPWSASQ